MYRLLLVMLAAGAIALSGCASDKDYYAPRDPSRATVSQYMEGNPNENLEETAGRNMFDN
ncbi:hypothetical protein ACFLQ8_00470 [Candidatus Auribacterota bacterium]